MKRRDFVRRLPGLSAGAAMCGPSLVLSACSGLNYVRARENAGRLLVREADLGEGRYALVESALTPRPVYLHRHGPDDVTAVLARCTHRGCQPEPVGDRLACPCHGSEFSLRGELLQGPAERPLTRFEVTREGDQLVIWLERRR